MALLPDGAARSGDHRGDRPRVRRVYDETLRVLRDAVGRARLGNDDRLAALRRLDDASRRLEKDAARVPFDDFVEREWEASPSLGGRMVGPPPRARSRPGSAAPGQMALPGILPEPRRPR